MELVVPVSPRGKVSAPSFSCLVATSGKQNSRDFVRDSVRKLSPWRMLWGLGTQMTQIQRTNGNPARYRHLLDKIIHFWCKQVYNFIYNSWCRPRLKHECCHRSIAGVERRKIPEFLTSFWPSCFQETLLVFLSAAFDLGIHDFHGSS